MKNSRSLIFCFELEYLRNLKFKNNIACKGSHSAGDSTSISFSHMNTVNMDTESAKYSSFFKTEYEKERQKYEVLINRLKCLS